MSKKLAIIGANEAITILIEKAKSLGYETHVFAWQCGDPGEKVADFYYPISIDEKEKILEKCQDIGICGVCSITSDYAAPTVAYVARNLGLPGNPERTDIVARDKYEMRKAFEAYGGIYCPRYYAVDADTELSKLTDISFPVIVKPIDRWSSKGITRVDQQDGLKMAVDYAIAESINKKAIVEEFMEGPEYSAECIVFNGEVSVLAFTQKMTTGYPHYIEIGHVQPADISIECQLYTKKIIKRAIKALDIKNSAAHVEFRILNNGDIGIIEIGARMGGDCIGTYLTPISTGMDYVKMVVDVACGNKPDFFVTNEPKPVRIIFIMNQHDLATYKNIPKEKIIRSKIYNTSFEKKAIDSSTRFGWYIL